MNFFALFLLVLNYLVIANTLSSNKVSISNKDILNELPCFCNLYWDPLCANDGKTYGNICAFNCELNRKFKNNFELKIIRKSIC